MPGFLHTALGHTLTSATVKEPTVDPVLFVVLLVVLVAVGLAFAAGPMRSRRPRQEPTTDRVHPRADITDRPAGADAESDDPDQGPSASR